VEDVASRNLSIRPLSVFARTPSLRLFRLADTIDRPLAAVPGLRRLGSTCMFKAVTPA
jgi:hypothetical protein